MLSAFALRDDVRLMMVVRTGDEGHSFGVCSAEGLWIGRDGVETEVSSFSFADDGLLRIKSRVRSVNDLLREGVCSGTASLGSVDICPMLSPVAFGGFIRSGLGRRLSIASSSTISCAGEGICTILADSGISAGTFKF